MDVETGIGMGPGRVSRVQTEDVVRDVHNDQGVGNPRLRRFPITVVTPAALAAVIAREQELLLRNVAPAKSASVATD
jgi:hypothetical protein